MPSVGMHAFPEPLMLHCATLLHTTKLYLCDSFHYGQFKISSSRNLHSISKLLGILEDIVIDLG